MTSWFWCLATDEDDPLDRFRVVRESLATARDLQQRDPRLLADLQEHSGLYETIWWVPAPWPRSGEIARC